DFGNKELIIAIHIFILVQSIFYFGAVNFKKIPLILTPIATLFVVIFLILFS
ncbi:unnamed protein product, partial [marine sediment metagenome]